jgi:hypothetical protein
MDRLHREENTRFRDLPPSDCDCAKRPGAGIDVSGDRRSVYFNRELTAALRLRIVPGYSWFGCPR